EKGTSNVPSSWSSAETVRSRTTTTSPDVTVALTESPLIVPLTLPPPMHPPGERMLPPSDVPFWTRSAVTVSVAPLVAAVARPVQSPLRFADGVAEEVEVTEPPELPEHAATDQTRDTRRRGRTTQKLRMSVSGGTRTLL